MQERVRELQSRYKKEHRQVAELTKQNQQLQARLWPLTPPPTDDPWWVCDSVWGF